MQSFDRIDRGILHLLSRDARASVSDISDKVGLSQSACTRRIQALERSGAITGYGTRLGQVVLGCRVTALVDITLNTQAEDVLRAFERAAGEIDGIVEGMLVSGSQDYRLKIVCRDLDDYERIHREHLGKLPGVATINSSFVLRSIATRSLHDAIFATESAE
jgi:Lrp/AsnC family transcriptional regulator, leucine-responsive regulatory protein